MDAPDFVQYVRRQAAALEQLIVQRRLAAQSSLRSRAFDDAVREDARAQCAALRRLRLDDVEAVVYSDKYGLQHERLMTCMVPYQAAVNMLLARMPSWLRDECVAELRRDEATRQAHTHAHAQPHVATWMQWQEHDMYTHTGKDYLARMGVSVKRRPCVFGVLGDAGHGKTTLLDALRLRTPSALSTAAGEAHGTTQMLRCFTLASPLHGGSSSSHGEGHADAADALTTTTTATTTTTTSSSSSSCMTFIDTPGHRLFAESRLHVQYICDVVLLVVSVVDELRVQTHECIKVALNMDRPVVVVLNKLDALRDAHDARAAVQRVLAQLSQIGLDVTLIRHEADLTPYTTRDAADTTASRAVFARMRSLDATYAGSLLHPVVHLHRHCLGVCVSARQRVRLPLLWRLLHTCADAVAPTCYTDGASMTTTASALHQHHHHHCEHTSSNAGTTALCEAHDCVVQAVVVESSKHLYNVEGFAHNAARRRIQAVLDAAVARRERRRDDAATYAMGAHARTPAALRHMHKRNRTSTASLLIDVVVREGVVRRGMHFVADQAEGCVTDMFDYDGHAVASASPGMAVTLVDRHSTSGCPGVGTHVLSMTSAATRRRVHHYRQLLQWFVELFPQKLHLLRPRGHDVTFAHLGDYGQLACTTSLEYQLLYGHAGPTQQQQPPQQQQHASLQPPSASALDVSSSSSSASSLALASSATSIAEYLMHVRNSFVRHDRDVDEDDDDRAPADTTTMTTTNAMVTSSSSTVTTVTTTSTTRRRLGQSLISADEAIALAHAWRRLQHATPAQSSDEHVQRLQQCTHVGVLLKVDCWHSARLLMRDVERAATRRVHLEVLGIRFGAVNADDIAFFGGAVRVIVCYRTPRATSVEVDRAVETQELFVLQTDHISDVTTFVRWCAVTLHMECAPDDTHDARLLAAATTTTTTTTTRTLPHSCSDDDKAATATTTAEQHAQQPLLSSSSSSHDEDGEASQQREYATVSPRRKRKLLVVDRTLTDDE